MNNYSIHTDLACESEASHDGGKRGTRYSETDKNGFKTARLAVLDKTGEEATGKRTGTYITIFSELICNLDEARFESLASLIAEEIDSLANSLLGGAPSCVLVAGLGNREITADNIGPKTVDKLTVTRHIQQHDAALFNRFGKVPLCAIAPGVLGQTGIETAELLSSVKECASPDLMIAIDALAARSTERLGATIQISDSGIFPGSGIGNKRSEISRETMNIPVIAIGVPTVVNSATLVYDALCRAGYTQIDAQIEKVLHEGESFYVSPRQSDTISERVSDILAHAIDEVFLY